MPIKFENKSELTLPTIRAEINFGRNYYSAVIPGVGRVLIDKSNNNYAQYWPDAVEPMPNHLAQDVAVSINELRNVLKNGVTVDDPKNFIAWLEKEQIPWDEDKSDKEKGHFVIKE